MGILDNITSSVNKGLAATNRATSTMKLKAQMNDALKRRQNLAAQLGASLYEATKDDENLRKGREALYDGIAACDEERAACQEEIARIESEAQSAAASAATTSCPFCGAKIGASDMFCSGCGKSMEEIRTAASAHTRGVDEEEQTGTYPGTVCPSCGAPVKAEDAFCMNCGSRLK